MNEISIVYNNLSSNTVTISYGNCPNYTRDDSNHLTGPWIVMVGGDRHIKKAMGVCN